MTSPPRYLSKKKMAGQGISKNLTDRAVWREASGPDDPWVNALARLDDYGEKTPLIDLLNSDCSLPQTARGYLADLIDRGVTKADGRPRIPAYRRSNIEAVLHMADKYVTECVKQRGLSVADALQNSVERYGSTGLITVETLSSYRAGRRGHARRRARPKVPPL